MEYKDPEIERFEFEALTDFNEEDVKMYEYRIPKDKEFKMCLRFALGRGFYRSRFTEMEDGYTVETNCLPDAFKSIMERAALDKYSYKNDVIADKLNSPYFKPYKINIELIDMFDAMEKFFKRNEKRRRYTSPS